MADDVIYLLGKTDPIGHFIPSYLFNSKKALDEFIKDDSNSLFLFKTGRPNNLFQNNTWYICYWVHKIIAGLDLTEYNWCDPISLTKYIQMGKKLENV